MYVPPIYWCVHNTLYTNGYLGHGTFISADFYDISDLVWFQILTQCDKKRVKRFLHMHFLIKRGVVQIQKRHSYLNGQEIYLSVFLICDKKNCIKQCHREKKLFLHRIRKCNLFKKIGISNIFFIFKCNFVQFILPPIFALSYGLFRFMIHIRLMIWRFYSRRRLVKKVIYRLLFCVFLFRNSIRKKHSLYWLIFRS